jgi:thioredoxin-like negative regulator of GroEL
MLGMARCHYNLHEVEEAGRLLAILITTNPDDAGALLERGQLAVHAGQAGEAEPLLRRAAALAPPYQREAQRLLCRCLESEGKEEAGDGEARLRETEAAINRVELEVQQANRNPNDVALRFEIAAELMRLGREEEGAAALFLVLEQAPEHGPARAALADFFDRTGQPRRAAHLRRTAAAG